MLQNSNYFQEETESEEYYLKIKNIDAKSTNYSTNFEKELNRLPQNLKFIKKYVYLELLPKIEKSIEELEKIKETPVYDEHLPNIKPLTVVQIESQITCMDMFETHNIKHMRQNKILYGTTEGSIYIYDLETQKIICDKSLGVLGRVENVATSTIKYFDAYLSRIAVTIRGDSNIYIFNYNHSFSDINIDCVINLKEGLQSDPNILLNSLIAGIKFSKDSFFMSITDYAGGVRIYKFNEIPQIKENKESKENLEKNQANFNKTLEKKENPMIQLSFQTGKKGNKTAETNEKLIPIIDKNSGATPQLLNYLKFKEIENFTIIQSNNKKEVEDINNKGKNPNLNDKKNVNINAGKDNKGKANSNGNNKNILVPEDNINNIYTVQPFFNENEDDLTPLLKFNKNQPFITFLQKKLIFEEKQTGGYSTCLITVGVYISFYMSNNLKFVSLYSHVTEKMKSVFKVIKSKGVGQLSAEESIALSSSMARKEKEYILFVKSKLENMNSIISNNTSNLNKNITNTNSDFIQTKSVINFTTLFPITQLIGQKLFNSYNNLLAVGMKDGSILVWDAELHVDKFLFQTQSSEIISLSIEENYLFAGSLDGHVYLYELVKGNLLYKCHHNAYKNYPIQNVIPFFSFMSLVIDTDQKMCIYMNKLKKKVGKLNLENSNKKYEISYFNRNLVNFNDEFIVFVCNKEKSENEQTNDLLELIKFQNQKIKNVLSEFDNDEFLNYYQNKYSENNLIFNKSHFVIYKVKDIILKCFPQLVMANKKGYSLKKMMKKYDLNNIPSFDNSKIFILIF